MLYFNNAASSFPKAPEVVQAVVGALTQPPCDPHRDGGRRDDPSLRCRRSLATLFGSDKPERVVLTAGATVSLNMLLGGLLKAGGHVVSSCAEHNALLRPLFRARKLGICSLTLLPCGALGEVEAEAVERALRPETTLVALGCINNVTGHRQDLAAIYRVCSTRGIPLILDAAQYCGELGVSLRSMPHAALVFAGHKGLGGPSGVGGFILGERVAPEPWLVGGTGILSESESMPSELPLTYEPGVPNHMGIQGLAAACDSLLAFGPARASEHLRSVVKQLREELAACTGIRWHGASDNPSGIVSLVLPNWPPRDLAYVLEQSYGIVARHGLHCAPLLHQHMGTLPDGTLRLSFSRFTQPDEIRQLIRALQELGGAL